MPTSLAERVLWILKTRGLNARQLAIKAGLSHTYIGSLIKGNLSNLTQASAVKIATAGGVDLTWLLTGEGSPEPGLSSPAALTQALALLGGRIADPVKEALRAEPPHPEWGVEEWLERALHLQGLYAKLPREE